ncbi:hypothetical protein ACFSTC_35940 [Nonomuraea ferruginea]
MADQMVGHFAQVLAQGDRVGQLAERVAIGVAALDDLDEVVETNGVFHASTIG